MARFRLKRFVQLSTRRERLYLAGEIVDGVIRVGMAIRVPVDDGDSRAAQICAIDYVDVDRAAGEAEVALQLDLGSADEEEQLRKTYNPGDEIEVVDDPSGPRR